MYLTIRDVVRYTFVDTNFVLNCLPVSVRTNMGAVMSSAGLEYKGY